MNRQVAIYVPSTINGNEPAGQLFERFAQEAKRLFANLFGGFTAYPAIGGWVNDQGNMIEENVMVIQAYCNELDASALYSLRRFAELMAADMGQECVSLAVDGNLEFVTAKPHVALAA